jgi:hypothetical protein
MATITTTSKILRSGSQSAAVVASRRLLHSLTRSLQQPTLPLTTVVTRRGMSSTLRAAPTWQTKPPSPNPCGGEILLNLTKENPYKDAVRFDWKNQKYTYEALNFNSMAIATGFLETGLQPGDVCLSWLPLHFAEHVRINKRKIQGICESDLRERLFGYKCCRVVAIRWCMMLFCGLSMNVGIVLSRAERNHVTLLAICAPDYFSIGCDSSLPKFRQLKNIHPCFSYIVFFLSHSLVLLLLFIHTLACNN